MEAFEDGKDTTLCEFYEKIGCCPNLDVCNKTHRNAPLNRSIILHHIFPDPDLFIGMLPKGVLEIDHTTKQRLIDAVFLDISIMLMEFGLLDDMVIAGNFSDNLFGSVIAIFHEADSAYAAQMALDGQYYAGRKIHVSLSPVPRISTAICFNINKYKECQIGSKCMFIHPYEPSPNIFNEVFSRSQKSYPSSFRNTKKKCLDSPTDALYGRTRYPTSSQQNF